MTDKSNQPDLGNLIADLETLEYFVQNFKSAIKSLPTEQQDDRLFRMENQVSEINFPQLISEAIVLQGIAQGRDSSAAESSFAPADSQAIEHLQELKKELTAKDQRIQEFKLSLADSVMDFKGLEKLNSGLHETIASLRSEITHMQLHTKDMSLKLTSTEKNYEVAQTSLSKTSEELLEIKSQSYNLKSRNADLEDQIKDLSAKVAHLSDESFTRGNELNKYKKVSGNLNESYELLKNRHSALEERTAEMETAIDSLQKEKSYLQNKLDSLLTGIPRNFKYSQPLSAQAESTILQPATFTPYIPFCFPERVPEVIKFKKELKQSFSKTFPKKHSASPKIFPQDLELRMEDEHTRILAFKTNFTCLLTEGFSHVYKTLEVAKKIAGPSANFSTTMKDFFPEPFEKATESLGKTRQKFLKLSTPYISCKELKTKEKPEFGIHYHSMDLLLSFLTRNIIEANYSELKHQVPLIEEISTEFKTRSRMEIINIFHEKLAFRYGYQLKSHKLTLHHGDFVQSFKRGAGLKSVLKTFENTLNSMVEKYEIFSSKKAGKGTSLKT